MCWNTKHVPSQYILLHKRDQRIRPRTGSGFEGFCSADSDKWTWAKSSTTFLFSSSSALSIFSFVFCPTSPAAFATLLKAPVTHEVPVRTYRFFIIAEPALLTVCSAAENADLVFSDTRNFWSTSRTLSPTTAVPALIFPPTVAVPTLIFSLSPIFLSKEATLDEAVEVNWCFSSKDFALLTASLPSIKPLASMLLTTSSAFWKADSVPAGALFSVNCMCQENVIRKFIT